MLHGLKNLVVANYGDLELCTSNKLMRIPGKNMDFAIEDDVYRFFEFCKRENDKDPAARYSEIIWNSHKQC